MSVSIETSLDLIAEALNGETTAGKGSIEASLSIIADALKAKTSDVLYVTFTYSETDTAWSADAELDDIADAVEAKKLVVGYDEDNGGLYQLESIGESAAVFSQSAVAENVLTKKTFTVGAEAVTYATATVTGYTAPASSEPTI